MLFSTAFFISGNMRQSILIVLFFLYCETTLAQGTLRLSSKELFQLTESSISLDSLIMADSSAILLPNHKATLIRTNYAWFGNYCVLDGAGVSGEDGLVQASERVERSEKVLFCILKQLKSEISL